MSQEVVIRDNKQKLPKDLPAYLSNPKNKTNLVNHVFRTWSIEFRRILQEGQYIYFANLNGTVTKISRNELNVLPWKSDHEEAGSKMFVFAKNIMDDHYNIDQIIIASPDTDVAVIACYQFATELSSLSKLWFKTGVGNKRRYVAIHETAREFGSTIFKILPAFHCITGCDSVSSFSGIGKKSALATLRANIDELMGLFEFGDSPLMNVQDDCVEAAIKFTCLLYDKQASDADINYLRFKLFTKKGLSGDKLPPTLDAVLLHLRRATYQCYIWKHACIPTLELPSPVENGWVLNGQEMEAELILLGAVPENILELVSCRCQKGCKSNACPCRKVKLICSHACNCDVKGDCENTEHFDKDDDDSDLDM